MTHITTAGSTEVPAYLALGQLGYEIERKYLDSDTEIWIARCGADEFSGASPLEVLGLILMRQTRGEGWKASDHEIDAYLREYYPDGLPESQN